MTNNFLRQYIPIVFFTLLLGVGYEFSFNNPSLGFYTVMSGSMEPKIKTGSLIVTSKKESYEIGDIVTFSSPKSSEIVSHEVSDVLTKDGRNVYLTKGNSNATTDPYVLDEDRILGWVEESVKQMPQAVVDFKNGKLNALSAILGRVMQLSKGKADPKLTKKLLEDMLK